MVRLFDTRAARAASTVLLIALVVAGLYAIRRTLFLFVLALFFAYLLTPVVDLLDRFSARRISRTLVLALVYLALVAVLVGAGVAVGARIVDEATSLAASLPTLVKGDKLPASWHVPPWLETLRARALEAVRKHFETGVEQAVPFLREFGARLVSILGNIGFALLVPILGFFFLKDGRRVKQAILELFDGERRALLTEIFADMNDLLAQYIRALVILSLATFTAYAIFLTIAGVPYSILLAGAAAVLEFIPVLGPLAAAVLAILVCLLSGYSKLALTVILFLAVYRMFQDYVLSPYLMSAGVELHPLLVIFGVLAGEQIAGVPGMFLSIPVLATLRVVWVRVQRARLAHGGDLATP